MRRSAGQRAYRGRAKRVRTTTTETETPAPGPLVRTSTYVPRAPLATRGWRFPMSVKEKKVRDINSAEYPINTTGSFTLLNGLVPGTDFNNRIGRKIFMNSLYIRGFCRHNNDFVANSASSGDLWRMIVFMDMQPNGAAPTVTDLLVTATSSSHLNMNNRDRFKVLIDKQYAPGPWTALVGPPVNISGDRTAFPVKKYKKINAETIYNAGAAGTIGDIISGALYMFWIGQYAAGSGVQGEAVVSTRLRFSDG